MNNNDVGTSIFAFIIAFALVVGIVVLEIKLITILVDWLTQGALTLTFKQGFALKVLVGILLPIDSPNLDKFKERD